MCARHKTTIFAAILALIVAWGVPAIAQGEDQKPVTLDDLRLAFYDYDHSLPLNAELKQLPDANSAEAALRTRWHLAYDSAHDQRVTAIFTLPKRFSPPFPAVILLAGSGGHKDSDYVRFAAELMSTLGYATLSIDAQYHGERARPNRSDDVHNIASVTERDAWIQTVIDLRRAVDYLQSRPDIDGKRIGYLGFSEGGILGGVFIGVEPRVSCACLAIPGGGFVAWAKALGYYNEANARAIEVAAAIIDPVNFIGRFSPRPLLMLSARKDELIPRFATEALFNAARNPKQIIWYDSGHVLPPKALLVDAKAFFVEHLGRRTPSAKSSSVGH